jgi:hypothetical protein
VNARSRACAWVRTRVGCMTRAQVWRRPKRGSTAECTAEHGSTPWAAADKATSFGCKLACKKTATGGEAFSRRSSGRCPLSRARVRETSNHGEAMAARPTGARPRGPAQKKGQGSASSPGLGCTGAGVHACAREMCPHGRARIRERASDGSHRRPGRWISRRLERLS